MKSPLWLIPLFLIHASAHFPLSWIKSTRGGGIVPTDESVLPAWQAALPEPLRRKGPKTLRRMQLGSVEIYLLGTAHVSFNSSVDVDLLLQAVQPDAILVELCEARIPLLEGDKDNNKANNETQTTNTTETQGSFWDTLNSIHQSQGGSRLQALSTLLLTRVQEDYAKELGVELGGEFQCAYKYWKARRKLSRRRYPHLILGDRPLHLTLVRSWESLGWFPKLKVVVGLVWSSIRKPNREEIQEWLASVMKEESDVLTKSFEELRQHFPSLYKTIIDERDAWLACKIVQSCRGLNSYASAARADGGKCTLVAIVGAGHVPGISQWLTSTTEKSPEEILSELVITKKWANDQVVQQEAIPMWIKEIIELQDMEDESFQWAQPGSSQQQQQPTSTAS
jgi:pheromone shutdown protein TraB